MESSDQKLIVGKLEFHGKAVRGGWMRWYPANREAEAFLASHNKRLHPKKQRPFLVDDIINELCGITGQEFKSRKAKSDENKMACFRKLEAWVEKKKLENQRKALPFEVIL